MLNIIRNNWYRLKEQKNYLIVAISLTIFSVALAVILTNNLKPKINIGIIGENQVIEDNSTLQVTYLEQEPPVSELIQNRYDAVVKFNDDGSYNIQTVKGEEFKQKLNQALQKEDITAQDTMPSRNIGTNIIGYMVMFLLMQGMLSTCFAVCLNAFYHVADTANMAGSSIIVLTSVLGGSFYDVGQKSSFLSKVLYILPQKGLMQFINDFEKQIVNQNDMIALGYVIIVSIAFVTIGVIKTRKDYVYHRSK